MTLSKFLRIFLGLLFLQGIVFQNIIHAQENSQQETDDYGLVLNENSKADLAYIRPDVDWNKYKKIFVRPLVVTDEAKDATPDRPSRSPHMRGSWLIPGEDVELMKSEFASIMTEKLEEGGFEVADGPGPEILVVAAAIIDIYLTAPVEASRTGAAKRGALMTQGGGSLTVAAALADGEDLTVLAQVADSRRPTTYWQKNDRRNNLEDMRRIYRAWGNIFVDRLQELQK